ILQCKGLTYTSFHEAISFPRDLLSERVTGYKATGTLVSLFTQLKRKDATCGGDAPLVRANQERVVKVAEMQHVMQLLHNSVMHETGTSDEFKKKNWELGDKLAILFGDFFLALAFNQASDIQNSTVLSTFAKGIESYVTCNFEDIPQPVSTEWWEDYTQHQCSWFPSAFECSLLVAGVKCPNELAAARTCGTNLVLEMQVCTEKYHIP
ncbi:unnamed protein product, partial [Ixodes hexagonus]